MDKHKCKLCFRSFSNGRALGGHMRSHMMNLPLSKPEEAFSRTIQLSFEAESASSSSSSDDDHGHTHPHDHDHQDDDDDKALCYGLRENPKRSIRLVDPEFSFAAADTGSVILQDRESETESSKNNPTRRRSKRPWNNNNNNYYNYNNERNKKQVVGEKSKTESWVEQEPASSVSDATTEEDVAYCLMMLSRDKWKRQKEEAQVEEAEEQYEEEEEEEESEEEEEDEAFEESEESQETMKVCKNRGGGGGGRYKCETCNKVFRSYQALGGHRASHKKMKVNVKVDEGEHNKSGPCVAEKKIHECPVCFRVFASGQALGGHKRTHVTNAATTLIPSTSSKFGNTFIDLNLPAPIDDDDASQIENSAVSDAEFVKTR
ncbi:zinc finger protein ZAT9 [Cajanus cajan]|uniref:zinc finger protein ZAT9 n=1 Tax=Cajanus cajan TaxID=3821 RepID=UPI00098DC753|nr:zinc finger protein ZAT9 [Cajanus cajan]XP_020208808.1 zinc finger protein ZAT9 [Cajanus cajan]XP_029126257.1 zinc finger protein ZAT9 [Cajanus cajan]